jgi:hypothetical protein
VQHEPFQRTKAKLVTTLRPTHYEDFVDASIRQFCATAKARLYYRHVPISTRTVTFWSITLNE